MISPELARVGAAIAHVRDREPVVVRTLALTLVSRANGSQGTTRDGRWARAATYREQRTGTLAVLACAGVGDVFRRWGWHCAIVRLVRVAPRQLDDDNAAAATKSVRDGVAAALAVNDRDPRVVWLVDQERGQACVRVELYRWDAGQASMPARGATKRPRSRSGHGPSDFAQPEASQRPSRPMTKMSQSKFKP